MDIDDIPFLAFSKSHDIYNISRPAAVGMQVNERWQDWMSHAKPCENETDGNSGYILFGRGKTSTKIWFMTKTLVSHWINIKMRYTL